MVVYSGDRSGSLEPVGDLMTKSGDSMESGRSTGGGLARTDSCDVGKGSMVFLGDFMGETGGLPKGDSTSFLILEDGTQSLKQLLT